MTPAIQEVKLIPLEKINIGQVQVRTREVGEGIEELAESIDKIGLLEPIVVCPVEEDQFEIVTGQRRFLAHQYLGRESILASVLEDRVTPGIAKAISLTENMLRRDLQSQDYIDACTSLFQEYGSIKKVSEELGLPYYRVSQYVKSEQLIPELQDMYRSEEINIDTALRAQKAATDPETKEIDKEAAITFAEEMKRMTGYQRRHFEKVAIENLGAPLEAVIEISRKQPKVFNLTLVVAENLKEALRKYSNDEGLDQNTAATNLLETSLNGLGYL